MSLTGGSTGISMCSGMKFSKGSGSSEGSSTDFSIDSSTGSSTGSAIKFSSGSIVSAISSTVAASTIGITMGCGSTSHLGSPPNAASMSFATSSFFETINRFTDASSSLPARLCASNNSPSSSRVLSIISFMALSISLIFSNNSANVVIYFQKSRIIC